MEYIVNENDIGKRLDNFLVEKLNKTRSYIKTLSNDKKITVNDINTKAGYILKLNDKVYIENIVDKLTLILPNKIDIDIVYEDDDIIVVNKQKGLVVHPGSGNYTNTLVNSLLYTHKDKLSSINGVIRPGIVHRIDKDTTGLLVVAKNDNSHKLLSEQFSVHSIKREYIALVKGIIAEDKIDINKPIGRNTTDRKKMGITDKNGRQAITHITVLERYYNDKVTLIKAVLETGRTHQIRVHMSSIGHPLVGDLTYGNKSNIRVNGHLLHAKVLGFIHPTTNKYIEFDSKLPFEFEDIINKLRKNN
ncbi:MAG: RluA family pseudouridine synthase [Clostridia bacterium]